MYKVTKAVVRFFAGEYDDEGNLLCELPVAAGKDEFEETCFFPFATGMLNTINQIERSLNEQGTPRPEQGLQGGVCGLPREAESREGSLGSDAGSQEGGDEAGRPAKDDGGGSHQACVEGWDECEQEPARCDESGEPAQGEPIRVVEPKDDLNRQSNAAWLIHKSILHEGRPASLGHCDAFVRSICNDVLARCYVAYCGDKMAGVCIALCHNNEAEASFEVRNLYVEPEFRSQGVAQALLARLLDWAKFSPGERTVFITTEGEPRPYYRALGFEPTHRICVSSLKKLRERLRG